MERSDATERLNEAELRAQDIKLFWKGYEIFRKENTNLEDAFAASVIKETERVYKQGLTKSELEKATEVLMIFQYAIKLTCDMAPGLTENLKEPETFVEYDPDTFFASSSQQGCLVAGVPNILEPENCYNFVVAKWKGETTRSVTSAIPDWSIVFTASTAPEEIAHDIFSRIKDPKFLSKAKKAAFKIYRKSLSTQDEFESHALYHTSDIEWRGLIWKKAFMTKYFPHWTGQIDQLIQRSQILRHEKQIKDQSFLHKLFKRNGK